MNLCCAEKIIEKANYEKKKIKLVKKFQKIKNFIEKDKRLVCLKIKDITEKEKSCVIKSFFFKKKR